MSGAAPNEGGNSRLISRQVLEGYRRERVFLAIVELAHEAGPAALTTTRIVKRGRMSRNTFYELFANKAECLDLACDFATDRLLAAIRGARAEDGGWRERLDRAISALLEAVSTEPRIAELCLVHTSSISTRGAELGVDPVIETLAKVIEDGGAAPGEVGQKSTRGLSEFVAATIVSIVVGRVRRGEAGELAGLQGELKELAARLWSEPAERVGTP
jgi:AcrR family transcriptional regulator